MNLSATTGIPWMKSSNNEAIMELDQRKQLLDCIKSEIQLYDGYEDMSSEAYDNLHDVENRVNRLLRRLIGQNDLVSKADSYVGKTVWYANKDISTIHLMTIERVRFMKWTVEFIGTGVRICNGERAYQWSSFEIDNEDFKEAMENDWIVEAGPQIDNFIKKVETARNEKIRSVTEKINSEYDDLIGTLKQYASGDMKVEKTPFLGSKSGTSHKDRVMNHICQYSWSDIVRSFGSDEEKAEVGPEPVDEMDAKIVEVSDES